MAQIAQPVLNQDHDDLIHDLAVDYYGRRIATCSSDKTVKIYDVENGQQKLVETLRGHEGPVWAVAWAHPRFGTIVASASFDARVLIWRLEGQQWTKVADLAHHTGSINALAWAPHDIGCILACASSDGDVSVYEFQDTTKWGHTMFSAHPMGANGVSWAPDASPRGASGASSGANTQNVNSTSRRFVTCGTDKTARVWEYNSTTTKYEQVAQLDGHKDLVRDVAWSPSMLSKSYIATASQDKTVRIWTSLPGSNDEKWTPVELTFDVPVWHVSWSPSGNVLAVNTADNRVSMWKEKVKGGWECVQKVDN